MWLDRTSVEQVRPAPVRGGDRTIVLGSGEFACRLIDALRSRRHARRRVIGVVTEGGAWTGTLCDVPVLGRSADLGRVIDAHQPTRIIVAVSERRRSLPIRHLIACAPRGILVEDGIELYEHLTGKVAIEFLTPSGLFLSSRLQPSRLHSALARAFSLLAAIAGLVLLSPLLALIAIAIKLDSRGPVCFVHHRVGLNGRPFPLIKFRSMYPVDRQRSEWARDNSDRVTRVGRVLRKFWLDELPELLNIVCGHMNLVGPRPHPVSNWLLFTMVLRNMPASGHPIPYCELRSMVRPGLTGWAQVRYRYANNLEEEVEKVKYDLYYVKYRSLWLDLRVALETVRLMFSGRGTAALEEQRQPASGLRADSVRAHG